MKVEPGPEDGGPSSMFQEDGASTDSTGTDVSWSALMTAGNGSRTSPKNEKPLLGVLGAMNIMAVGIGCQRDELNSPKIASTTWSVSLSAVGKSSVKGISSLRSWVARRCTRGLVTWT